MKANFLKMKYVCLYGCVCVWIFVSLIFALHLCTHERTNNILSMFAKENWKTVMKTKSLTFSFIQVMEEKKLYEIVWTLNIVQLHKYIQFITIFIFHLHALITICLTPFSALQNLLNFSKCSHVWRRKRNASCIHLQHQDLKGCEFIMSVQQIKYTENTEAKHILENMYNNKFSIIIKNITIYAFTFYLRNKLHHKINDIYSQSDNFFASISIFFLLRFIFDIFSEMKSMRLHLYWKYPFHDNSFILIIIYQFE